MQLLGNLTPLAYWPDTADCCGYIAKVNLSAAERSRGQKKNRKMLIRNGAGYLKCSSISSEQLLTLGPNLPH